MDQRRKTGDRQKTGAMFLQRLIRGSSLWREGNSHTQTDSEPTELPTDPVLKAAPKKQGLGSVPMLME